MKTLYLLLLVAVIVFPRCNLIAQTPDSLGIYTIATSFPSYRGGDDSLYHFIYDHIAYPKDAL